MTRGKMVFIDKNAITKRLEMYVTDEFNGDMYPSYYGKEIACTLEKVTNLEKFIRYANFFNEQYFKYDDFKINKLKMKDNRIDLKHKYFDNWFSDYLYFKNESGEKIEVLCKKAPEPIILEDGETMVTYFGDDVIYSLEQLNLQ